MSKSRKFQADPSLMDSPSKAKQPQHSLPASSGIAAAAVDRLKDERAGSSRLAQQLDQGVQRIADEDGETLADITRSLMPRTLAAYSAQLQENPGEGAAIASMFLEGVAAIPSARSTLPVQSISQSISAGTESGAMQALPGSAAKD